MNNNYSPLRYPGGKTRLINLIKDVINLNELNGGVYIEPYAGGASLALSLIIDGCMDRVVINDYDRSIYAFWECALHQTESLIEKIIDTPVTIEEWKRQRDIQKNKATASVLDLGFSTFFLNRTNRSGILKAGVIGGLGQAGAYKIDARFNKDVLIKKIQSIACYRDRIIVSNFDAIHLLSRYKNVASKNLFFLDPPYYVKGRDLYVNYYKEADHIALAQSIQGRKRINWLMTYDEHPQILDMYSKCNISRFQLSYSAGESKQGTELLISSSGLLIPR